MLDDETKKKLEKICNDHIKKVIEETREEISSGALLDKLEKDPKLKELNDKTKNKIEEEIRAFLEKSGQ